MNIQKNILFSAFMLVIVLSVSGIASAEEQSEMTNQQYCEKEAKEAGMPEGQDSEDYVAQCLSEIEAKSGSMEESKPES